MWPSSVNLTFNLPEQMFQMAYQPLKENKCAKLFWNPCINVEVKAQTNPDRCMHTRMHIHLTKIVTARSRFTTNRLDKKQYLPLVKILLLVFILWNKNSSYSEKGKYPLFILNMICQKTKALHTIFNQFWALIHVHCTMIWRIKPRLNHYLA